MTPSQIFVVFLLFAGIIAFMLLPLAILIAIGNPFLITLWVIFMIVLSLLILKHLLSKMKTATMLLLSWYGNCYALYTPTVPSKNGNIVTGFVLHDPLTKVQKLPAGPFVVYIKSNTAMTKDDPTDPQVDVVVYALVHVQLEEELEDMARMMHLLNGADMVYDLAKRSDKYKQDVYFRKEEKDYTSVEVKSETCVPLAVFQRELLEAPFNEAVGRAIPSYTLREALDNVPAIQGKINDRLNEPGTAFTVNKVRDIFKVFDVTVIGISPVLEAVRKAVVAKAIAYKEGQATIVTAEASATARGIAATAEANAITTVAASLNKPGGDKVLAAETLQKMKDVHFITGLDPLGAGLGLLNSKKGGSTPPQPPQP